MMANRTHSYSLLFSFLLVYINSEHANTLNFSDSGASRSVAREAPFKNIHTNARVDMREELDISGLNPRRFRSASFAGRGNSDEPERNLPVPTKDAKKARIKTAKCSVKVCKRCARPCTPSPPKVENQIC